VISRPSWPALENSTSKELWDSVVHDLNDPDKPNSLPVSDATPALFDERMREYRADPAVGLHWSSVREHLLKML
jgi:hypothetical protein